MKTNLIKARITKSKSVPRELMLTWIWIITMLLAPPGNLVAKTPGIGELKKGKTTRNTQELFLILCENTKWTHEFSPRKQCELGNATSSDASVAEITGTDGDAGGSVTISASDAGKATLTIEVTQNAGNDINTDNSQPSQVTVKITIYVLVVPCDHYHRPSEPPVLPPAEDFPKPVEPAKESTPTPTATPSPKANKPGGGDNAGQPKTGGNKSQPTPTPTPKPLPKTPQGGKSAQKTPTPTPGKTTKTPADKTSGGSKLQTTNSPGVVTKTVTVMDNGELVGQVVANVPDNPDGTFTGTVEAQPVGKTEEEQSRNEAKLKQVVLTVGDQQVKPEDKTFTYTVQPEAANQPLMVLLTYKQKEIAKTYVPPQPVAPSQTTPGTTPSFCQTGRNVVIPQTSNGTVGPTDSIKIGGQTVPLIVKTQQQSVVRDTSTTLGPTELEISQDGQTTRTPIQNMSVQLSSDKNRLKQGEQTPLKVTVSGATDIAQPVGLEITNNSTNIVQLAGGNQHVVIQPSDVGAGGNCTKTFTLTGRQPGPFNIRATLELPTGQTHN